MVDNDKYGIQAIKQVDGQWISLARELYVGGGTQYDAWAVTWWESDPREGPCDVVSDVTIGCDEDDQAEAKCRNYYDNAKRLD